MSTNSPLWAPDANAEKEREGRIALALLRGVLEALRGNRLVAPVMGLAIAAIFSQWLPLPRLASWYAVMLLGLTPQLVMLGRFPAGALSMAEARKWTRIAAGTNLLFVISWASMGWFLWVPDRPMDHLLLQLILAATLAAHATLTAPCRAIARPALLIYLAVMVAVPLQRHNMAALYWAAVSLAYVAFIALISRQTHARARAAIMAGEERNSLLAELVMAKLESDRGRDQAEAASLAKSQFLANMSHELRTPLNAILGFSELIASRLYDKDPERNYEYAALVHSSGRHLLALINDILDLAKIEAGRWKLDEAELDLHNIAADALQLVAWRAKDSGALLDNEIAADLPLLHGDERAIKQILINLLSNAVKFTPADGRITAFARTAKDGGLVFGVRDTGVGIAPEDQKQVFDSFGQGTHDVTLADKGTGLGLAIVKGLVEAHGGQVSLESQIGRGTTVSIYMPQARIIPRRNNAQSQVA